LGAKRGYLLFLKGERIRIENEVAEQLEIEEEFILQAFPSSDTADAEHRNDAVEQQHLHNVNMYRVQPLDQILLFEGDVPSFLHFFFSTSNRKRLHKSHH